MTPKIINIITNVIAVALALLEPLSAYFEKEAFNWKTFLICLGGALLSYFTGKSGVNILQNAAVKQTALATETLQDKKND